MEQTTHRSINRGIKITINTKQRFQLMQLIQGEYVERAKTDSDFADYATEKLGFKVNHNIVGHCREALEIPATKFAKSVPADLLDRTALLEKRVAELEDRLQAHLVTLRREKLL